MLRFGLSPQKETKQRRGECHSLLDHLCDSFPSTKLCVAPRSKPCSSEPPLAAEAKVLLVLPISFSCPEPPFPPCILALAPMTLLQPTSIQHHRPLPTPQADNRGTESVDIYFYPSQKGCPDHPSPALWSPCWRKNSRKVWCHIRNIIEA